MAEIDDLKRLENQIYQYYPELKRESEDIKDERRQQLFMQLRSSFPVVQLSPLDAVCSLTNIKNLLEKCKDCVQDPLGNFPEMEAASPSMSIFETCGDEFLSTKKTRWPSRKRKSRSALVRRSENEEFRNEFKEQDSPLSLSILIPQVVKGSDKMEISIDLGGLDASQRLFGSRVEGLLRNRSNSGNLFEDLTVDENSTSPHQKMISQIFPDAPNAIEKIHDSNDKQEDEMLSCLLSQVLVDNHQTETLQATNVLANININGSSNYDTGIPALNDTYEQQPTKKKRQRKSKKDVEKGVPKKRGRKPKNKQSKEDISENFEMPKSDLAKYVELFSNTCNMAGSATPAASSTISQQLVTSTTHYLEPSDHPPITYYLEGDWQNGGSCQLIQTESTQIDSGQEEFNMAELVNYIDNVGDTANDIARVLDGPSSLPILVQESHTQSNGAVPPPAHVYDGLLDLSKKSTIASEINNVSVEIHPDILPLDLSLKSFSLNEPPTDDDLVPMKSIVSSGTLETTAEVFDIHDYDSFGPGLDMPLIDIEDNIHAFMELTNSEVITSATEKVTGAVVCASSIVENTSSTLPDYDFELSEILGDNTVKKNNCNFENKSRSQFDAVKEVYLKTDAEETLKSKQSQNVNNITEISKPVNNNAHHCDDVGVLKDSSTSSQLESNLTQAIFVRENFNDTVLENAVKEDNLTNIESSSCEVKICNLSTSQCLDQIDEAHGDSSDKSSIDFLFVDTESLIANKTKLAYDRSAIISELDTVAEHLTTPECGQTVVESEQNYSHDHNGIACDLSTNEDHSKSIDLIEDNQGHHVSVHLPMPQLTLMEENSEEFSYNYEFGFESGEEREDITGVSEKPRLGDVHHYDRNDENKLNRDDGVVNGCNDSGIETCVFSTGCENTETKTKSPVMTIDDERKEVSAFDDSAICCKQGDGNAIHEFETGPKDLMENSYFERNENQNISYEQKLRAAGSHGIKIENCYSESMRQNDETPDKMLLKDVLAVTETKQSDAPPPNLSVLEMESKLDDVCLDFDDELEDDVLSLATSCFNSSDDERFPNFDENIVGTSSNKNNEIIDARVFNMENDEQLDDKSNVIKVEVTQPSTDVPSDIFKKFKIPKISMTTATTKHSNSAASAATAAPLPMVILPPNSFNRQTVKTELESIKPANFEKITRTVQNVCAVTPLTLQHPTYTGVTAAIPQSSLITVPPLIRDMLQLTPPLIGEELKEVNAVATKQVTCKRGEFAGYGGDGRNFGPPTIVVAKTFGVTCLPFLVERCFTLASCKLSHTFREPETVRNTLISLSEEDLNIAYKFAYNHEIVFRRYMHEFCRVYFERNNRMKLLHMVRDCERYKGGGEILVTIFHSLLYCGLNKVNACRQVLSNSRDRSRPTIDALINIIMEADWTMFCDYIEQFSDIPSYHFRLNVLHQMASSILRANDQGMTSLFFKCLVNLDPNDVGLVQSSPILMQLLELIKNGQICR